MTFGPAADRPRAWWNLCRAEGVSTMFDPESPTFAADAESHTAMVHPEHNAALARGERYVPVEVPA